MAGVRSSEGGTSQGRPLRVDIFASGFHGEGAFGGVGLRPTKASIARRWRLALFPVLPKPEVQKGASFSGFASGPRRIRHSQDVGGSSCIAVTRGKWPKPRGEHRSPCFVLTIAQAIQSGDSRFRCWRAGRDLFSRLEADCHLGPHLYRAPALHRRLIAELRPGHRLAQLRAGFQFRYFALGIDEELAADHSAGGLP